MKTEFKNNEEVVVVIGSGAGGGVLANALAQKGIDVVCLEAGPRLSFSDIVNNEAEMFPRITWLDERISEGDTIPGLPLWTCKSVGGTTMHWTAACPRLHEYELRARSTYGHIEGANLADWPLDYGELEQYYDRGERLMSVSGTHGLKPMPANNNALVQSTGARNIGYTQVDTGHVAINSTPRDGRAACLQLGFCTSGCATGAKWSTLYTEIPRAEKTGHFELRDRCMVTRILTGESGRASEIEYFDAEGRARRQKARLVCVAGNAVETTRLLLNSGNSKHPDGLANSSDQVGRNYMRHVLAAVVAVMPGKVAMYKGAQVAGYIHDERRHDTSRGFTGGFILHTVPFSPETMAGLLMQGEWGEDFVRKMNSYENMAGCMMVGEDLPESTNRITLHPTKKDRAGLPVPVVHYRFHDNSRAMQEYFVKVCHKLYGSLGAEDFIDQRLFPATHNMGVARMGEDPKTSVCNPWGQTHDVDNLFISDGSVFPTSGSANPTLTIVSLVLRQADYIAGELERGTL
ncbi:MAG: GMC family oxidoreductase [Gammaproteobacteria bacterium]